ncbi:MAG: type II secretion system protein [Planctomycetes bacterium]|nr:type II secretion system protein [Planctomycetota bacterium]
MHGRRRPGFTLIETVASLVILGLAVPPMLWAIREVHIQRVDPILTSRARWLAIEKIEDVIADRHSTTRGYSYLVGGNYAAETPIATDTAFNRSVTFTETLADLSTAGSGYMNVAVDVSWTDGDGDAQTLSVATVLTDYTP